MPRNASARFVSGPATATIAYAYLPRSRVGSTGIWPHEMPAIASMISDVGPMWTSGLSVMWPVSSGVRSPSAMAAKP